MTGAQTIQSLGLSEDSTKTSKVVSLITSSSLQTENKHQAVIYSPKPKSLNHKTMASHLLLLKSVPQEIKAY